MAAPQVAQVAPGGAGWEMASSAPPAMSGDVACPRCATLNGRHMRFCVGCGQRLANEEPPVGVPFSPPVAQPVAQAAAPQQIAGVPPQSAPVAVAQPQGALPPGVTVCWRCRGAGDPGAAFCKFCGARYEDAGVPPASPTGPQQIAPPSRSVAVTVGEPQPAIVAPAPQPGALPAATPWPAPGSPSGGYAPAPLQPTAPGGSPIPQPARAPGEPIASLTAILKDGSDGRVFPIYSEQADIGRTEGDVVLSDDPYLSPRHARLRRRGEGWLLRDLDSANGIYVRIREPVDLADGDMILLGQQVLRFELLDDGELPLGPATQHGVLMFGTPEVPRMARLTQYTTEGVGRDVHYVYRDETVLGRENGDIVFTDDPFLSRRHAAITADRMSRRFVLRDLGSSNGTAVRFHGERVLAPGDQFRVGRHLFRFELAAGGRVGR